MKNYYFLLQRSVYNIMYLFNFKLSLKFFFQFFFTLNKNHIFNYSFFFFKTNLLYFLFFFKQVISLFLLSEFFFKKIVSIISFSFFLLLDTLMLFFKGLILKWQESFFYLNDKNLLFIVSNILKMNSSTKIGNLSDIAIVDYLRSYQRFSINFNLLSLSFANRLNLKIYFDDLDYFQSLNTLYKSSIWLEREVWDLFGIFFINNFDLRRILTDYGFMGHPLRRDFPMSGFTELFYNYSKKKIIYESVSLSQKYRTFYFEKKWISNEIFYSFYYIFFFVVFTLVFFFFFRYRNILQKFDLDFFINQKEKLILLLKKIISLSNFFTNNSQKVKSNKNIKLKKFHLFLWVYKMYVFLYNLKIYKNLLNLYRIEQLDFIEKQIFFRNYLISLYNYKFLNFILDISIYIIMVLTNYIILYPLLLIITIDAFGYNSLKIFLLLFSNFLIFFILYIFMRKNIMKLLENYTMSLATPLLVKKVLKNKLVRKFISRINSNRFYFLPVTKTLKKHSNIRASNAELVIRDVLFSWNFLVFDMDDIIYEQFIIEDYNQEGCPTDGFYSFLALEDSKSEKKGFISPFPPSLYNNSAFFSENYNWKISDMASEFTSTAIFSKININKVITDRENDFRFFHRKGFFVNNLTIHSFILCLYGPIFISFLSFSYYMYNCTIAEMFNTDIFSSITPFINIENISSVESHQIDHVPYGYTDLYLLNNLEKLDIATDHLSYFYGNLHAFSYYEEFKSFLINFFSSATEFGDNFFFIDFWFSLLIGSFFEMYDILGEPYGNLSHFDYTTAAVKVLYDIQEQLYYLNDNFKRGFYPLLNLKRNSFLREAAIYSDFNKDLAYDRLQNTFFKNFIFKELYQIELFNYKKSVKLNTLIQENKVILESYIEIFPQTPKIHFNIFANNFYYFDKNYENYYTYIWDGKNYFLNLYQNQYLYNNNIFLTYYKKLNFDIKNLNNNFLYFTENKKILLKFNFDKLSTLTKTEKEIKTLVSNIYTKIVNNSYYFFYETNLFCNPLKFNSKDQSVLFFKSYFEPIVQNESNFVSFDYYKDDGTLFDSGYQRVGPRLIPAKRLGFVKLFLREDILKLYHKYRYFDYQNNNNSGNKITQFFPLINKTPFKSTRHFNFPYMPFEPSVLDVKYDLKYFVSIKQFFKRNKGTYFLPPKMFENEDPDAFVEKLNLREKRRATNSDFLMKYYLQSYTTKNKKIVHPSIPAAVQYPSNPPVPINYNVLNNILNFNQKQPDLDKLFYELKINRFNRVNTYYKSMLKSRRFYYNASYSLTNGLKLRYKMLLKNLLLKEYLFLNLNKYYYDNAYNLIQINNKYFLKDNFNLHFKFFYNPYFTFIFEKINFQNNLLEPKLQQSEYDNYKMNTLLKLNNFDYINLQATTRLFRTNALNDSFILRQQLYSRPTDYLTKVDVLDRSNVRGFSGLLDRRLYLGERAFTNYIFYRTNKSINEQNVKSLLNDKINAYFFYEHEVMPLGYSESNFRVMELFNITENFELTPSFLGTAELGQDLFYRYNVYDFMDKALLTHTPAYEGEEALYNHKFLMFDPVTLINSQSELNDLFKYLPEYEISPDIYGFDEDAKLVVNDDFNDREDRDEESGIYSYRAPGITVKNSNMLSSYYLDFFNSPEYFESDFHLDEKSQIVNQLNENYKEKGRHVYNPGSFGNMKKISRRHMPGIDYLKGRDSRFLLPPIEEATDEDEENEHLFDYGKNENQWKSSPVYGFYSDFHNSYRILTPNYVSPFKTGGNRLTDFFSNAITSISNNYPYKLSEPFGLNNKSFNKVLLNTVSRVEQIDLTFNDNFLDEFQSTKIEYVYPDMSKIEAYPTLTKFYDKDLISFSEFSKIYQNANLTSKELKALHDNICFYDAHKDIDGICLDFNVDFPDALENPMDLGERYNFLVHTYKNYKHLFEGPDFSGLKEYLNFEYNLPSAKNKKIYYENYTIHNKIRKKYLAVFDPEHLPLLSKIVDPALKINPQIYLPTINFSEYGTENQHLRTYPITSENILDGEFCEDLANENATNSAHTAEIPKFDFFKSRLVSLPLNKKSFFSNDTNFYYPYSKRPIYSGYVWKFASIEVPSHYQKSILYEDKTYSGIEDDDEDDFWIRHYKTPLVLTGRHEINLFKPNSEFSYFISKDIKKYELSLKNFFLNGFLRLFFITHHHKSFNGGDLINEFISHDSSTTKKLPRIFDVTLANESNHFIKKNYLNAIETLELIKVKEDLGRQQILPILFRKSADFYTNEFFDILNMFIVVWFCYISILFYIFLFRKFILFIYKEYGLIFKSYWYEDWLWYYINYLDFEYKKKHHMQIISINKNYLFTNKYEFFIYQDFEEVYHELGDPVKLFGCNRKVEYNFLKDKLVFFNNDNNIVTPFPFFFFNLFLNKLKNTKFRYRNTKFYLFFKIIFNKFFNFYSSNFKKNNKFTQNFYYIFGIFSYYFFSDNSYDSSPDREQFLNYPKSKDDCYIDGFAYSKDLVVLQEKLKKHNIENYLQLNKKKGLIKNKRLFLLKYKKFCRKFL